MIERSRVAVVGDGPMVLGFRLAGVKEHSVAEDQESFEKELMRMLDSGSASVIIVPQKMLSGAGPKLAKSVSQRLVPIVVGIPDREGFGESGEDLRKMLKKSLGIDVRHTG